MSRDRGGPLRLVDFDRVSCAALARSEAIVRGLLPGGLRDGREWVALNPRRKDQRLGSFKVNLDSGKWGDFARGDRGRDLVSLVAYVAQISQRDAAIRLAETLGIDPFTDRH